MFEAEPRTFTSGPFESNVRLGFRPPPLLLWPPPPPPPWLPPPPPPPPPCCGLRPPLRERFTSAPIYRALLLTARRVRHVSMDARVRLAQQTQGSSFAIRT